MADIIYTGIMPGLTGITSGLYPDGTFVQVNETGQVYRIAGGAPLYVSTWSAFGGAQPAALQRWWSRAWGPQKPWSTKEDEGGADGPAAPPARRPRHC